MEELLEGMQKQGWAGVPLSSCELELQELMRQIDIMVAQKKVEWDAELQGMEARLDLREQELAAARATLEQKHKESCQIKQGIVALLELQDAAVGMAKLVLEKEMIQVGMLRQQLEELEKGKQDLVLQYEEQLTSFREELAKLKRSYEKLQRKLLKESREETRSRAEDRSEVGRLCKKIEEFRQKSLEWERQRLQYQQQVVTLEAHRKTLAEQYEQIQQQTVSYQSRKQLLEQSGTASQSEVQHLRSQLERANDTICACELTVEGLNMSVEDLSAANQRLTEEQERIQEELRQSQIQLQVLVEEKGELKETLKAQKEFIRSASFHQNQLKKELARTKEALQTREHHSRSMEASPEERWDLELVARMRSEEERLPIQLEASRKIEKSLQAEVARLQTSLESANTKCIELNGDVIRSHEEMRRIEEEHSRCKLQVKKLKEELSQAEQTRGSQIEGMKKEVCQLTVELHQRDITVAAVSSSASNMERQLRAEAEKAERKAVEHKVTQVQLETLRIENQHLAEILEKVESQTARKQEVSLSDLRDSYVASLSNLEQENQQLKKELAEVGAKLEVSVQACQDKYQSVLQLTQSKLAEMRSTEDRRIKELQQRHQEEMKKLQADMEETTQRYEEEIRKLRAQRLPPGSSPHATGADGPAQHSSNSTSSLESLHRVASASPHPDGNEADFSDSASVESLPLSHLEEFLPLSPLPASPVCSIASRFLAEEEVRSQELLKRLDAHIQELKNESEETVKKYLHADSLPPQTSSK
ncbi:centrosomal protein of 63 kDa isoform X3 [Latimeria chalumnae]|uniref:centrosomal protein of 63 kDa isoform X3 n=1 Tax=Latimeria chalumnae TaxID=7897 RepID=UPI00313E15AF